MTNLSPIFANLIAFGWLIILASSAYGWGRAILRLCNLEPHVGLCIVLSLGLGLGTLSLEMFVLGILRLFFLPVVLGLLIVGTGLGAFLGRRDRNALFRQLMGLNWHRVLTGPLWYIKWMSWGVVLLMFIQTLLANALVPPLAWDEIAYHLALPKLYLQEHKLIFIPYIMQSLWPFNTEMLFTISLLLGNDILPHLIVLLMSMLAMTSIYLVTARFATAPAPWLAFAFFTATPMVKNLSGLAFNDIPLAAYISLALLAFSLWVEQFSTGYLIVAALLSGFAMGTKLSGGGFALLFALWAGWVAARSSTPLNAKVGIHALLTFGLVSLGVASPWYIRSFVETGNPVWPLVNDLFHGKYWDPIGTRNFMKWMTHKRPPLSVFTVLTMIWQVPADYGGIMRWLIAPFIIPFSGIFIFRPQKFAHGLLGVGAAYYLMWAIFLGHQTRFLLPLVPFLAVLSALTFDQWYHFVTRRWGQWLMSALIIGALFWTVWPSPNYLQFLRTERWPYVTGKMSREEFLTHNCDIWLTFQWANQELPLEAKALFLPYETRGYYFDRDYVWGNVIGQRYIRFERYDDIEALRARLHKLGITHIVENPHWVYADLEHWEHNRALMLDLEQNCSQLLFEENQIQIYQLSEHCNE